VEEMTIAQRHVHYLAAAAATMIYKLTLGFSQWPVVAWNSVSSCPSPSYKSSAKAHVIQNNIQSSPVGHIKNTLVVYMYMVESSRLNPRKINAENPSVWVPVPSVSRRSPPLLTRHKSYKYL
jgi:hypothetical protein